MNLSNTAAEKIANYLLQINAIKLKPNEPFTWASGWKSPIYCDNRISLSHVEVRNFIKIELSKLTLSDNLNRFVTSRLGSLTPTHRISLTTFTK